MKLYRATAGVGFAALAACVVSQSDPSSPRIASGEPPSGNGYVDLGRYAPTRTLASPRIMDWSSQRYEGRATYGMSARDAEIATHAAPMAAPVTNWTVQTGAAVTAQPAVIGASWTAPTANDMLFFAVAAASATGGGITGGASANAKNANVFGLSALYGGVPPTLAWSNGQSTGGLDRTAMALSLDGTKVYGIDTSGRLRCTTTSWVASGAETGGGADCSAPWTGAYLNTQCTTAANGTTVGVNGSSPWIDYSSATQDIYFGDNCGYLNHVNGQTGNKVWRIQPGAVLSTTVAAFQSSPVVINGTLYIGDDAGRLYKVTGASGASAPNAAAISTFDACSAITGTAPCAGFVASGAGASASPWAIRAPIGYDVTNGHVYAVSNDYVFELASTGTFGNTSASPKYLSSGGTGPMYAAPTLDTTNHYLYTQFNSTLYKLFTPFTAASSVYSTRLTNHATDTFGSPLPYNGAVYIGDSAGVLERFDCNGVGAPASLDGLTSSNAKSFTGGNAVTTGVGLDNQTGDVIVGFSTVTAGVAGGPGGVAQALQSSGTQFVCPTGTALTPTTGGDTCNPTCTTSCTAPPHATAVCTSGVCQYTCVSGFTDCSGNIATAGCTDLTTDPTNCGGCGMACSPANVQSVSCTAGVCSGRCKDGYVDCDGSRRTNGCETSASCSACCGGTICQPGQMCFDPGYNVGGGLGACAVPAASQLPQECATIAEGASATVSCPTGQPITAITFADYGSPGGTCGESGTAAVLACNMIPDQTTCTNGTNAPNCAWNVPTGTCIPLACSTLLASVTCGANTNCAWDAHTSTCTGAIGFRHYYGAAGSKFSPNCAQDISQSPLATGTCLKENSCSFLADNEIYGNSTANNPVAGTTALPLSPACTAGNNCAANPCPGITKSLDVQVTCGACVGKRIFVSKFGTAGNFSAVQQGTLPDGGPAYVPVGGLITIDASLCQGDAAAAGLTGDYKAWIGSKVADAGPTGGSASNRLTHPTNVYYQLPSGTIIANSWTGLTSGSLVNPINQLATGAVISGNTGVWTGTTTGGANVESQNCSDWTTSSSSGAVGQIGETALSDSGWTSNPGFGCNNIFAVYCIEQ